MDATIPRNEIIKEIISSMDSSTIIGYTVKHSLWKAKELADLELVIMHLKDCIRDNPTAMQQILGDKLVEMINKYKITENL